MEPAKKLPWASPSPLDGLPRAAEPEARPDAALSSILRVVRAPEGPGRGSAMGRPPASAQEWTGLIERVRAAASRAREAEAQAQEQDQRVQDLLERVREDVAAASERVRAAEARVQTIEAQAEARIRAAEAKAEAAQALAESAEERARIAEAWLARVQETIASEFAAFPESRMLG